MGDGAYTGDHTKLFISIERNQDVDVWDGGYVRGGVGGGSTFICKDGVDGSSFLILNLFTPKPMSQYSWLHQTIPNTPSSVLLRLCINRNSLFNCLTFSTWISAARHILNILLCLACFFLIHILSVISSGSMSWMPYRHVSRWTMWTKVWSSNMFGRVKKWCWVSRTIIPSSNCCARCWMGSWRFLECVFIAGGEATISTIGGNPRGKLAYQMWYICHI